MEMHITVETDNKKVTSKEFLEATEFMLKLLLPESILRKIKLDLVFSSDEALHGDWAQLRVLDTNKYSRAFEIYIRPTLSRENQLKSLAHELTHLKQYATNYVPSVIRTRKKSNYEPYNIYYTDPMEIEAFGRELGLFLAWHHELQERKKLKDKGAN